ncbi:hypothetical protein BX616_008981 [Lobosporangium transversale]|nr:hypothetical protein BX616_008981 [Lobosporangium transversale]
MDISQPSEPFALRFSSNLMVGVTRVYAKQYSFYHIDVNNMWVRLKRDLAEVQSSDIIMLQPEARIESITFDYDMAVERDTLRPMTHAIQNIDIETSRRNHSRELAIEFGWATQPAMDLRNSQSENLSCSNNILVVPADIERRRKITLDEHMQPSDTEQVIPVYRGLNMSDEAFVMDDSSLFIDAEGNLVGYMPTLGVDDSLDTAIAPQLPIARGALGKRRRDEQGRDRVLEVIEESVHAELPETEAYQILGHDLSLETGIGAIVARKKLRIEQRQPKATRLIIDDRTMLSPNEIYESGKNFTQRQITLIQERNFKQMVASSKTFIDVLLGRPLCVSGYDNELATFWSIASTRAFEMPQMDFRKGLVTSGQVRVANDSLLYNAEQVDDTVAEVPELEIRRRHGSSDRALTPLDLGISGISTGSAATNRQSAHMPWSTELRTSVSVHSEHSSTGSDRLRWDFEAVFDPVTGRSIQRQRQRSESSRSDLGPRDLREEPLARHHHRATSRSRSHSRDAFMTANYQRPEGGGPNSSMDAYDFFMDLQERAHDLNGQMEVSTATQERAAVEQETDNFLNYIRSILREVKASSLSLMDLVSTHRRRDVVAAAFYHILALSTMGWVRPLQESSYGDIHIEVIKQ